jgi:hypothetical protein
VMAEYVSEGDSRQRWWEMMPVTVIIYEMLLHGPEKDPHKFKYVRSE